MLIVLVFFQKPIIAKISKNKSLRKAILFSSSNDYTVIILNEQIVRIFLFIKLSIDI
jgi:hypothetical protein